jgi:hypothetical protein
MKKRGDAPFTILNRLVSSSAVSAAATVTTAISATAAVTIATATSAAIATTTVSTTAAAAAISAAAITAAAATAISAASVSTTAAATATIAAAATTAISTATAAATGFIGFFHCHLFSANGCVVQCFDCTFRLGLVRHVYKPEAFTPSRLPIHHHFCKIHCAIQFEHFFQVHIIKIIGKTCYKKLHADKFKR